MTTNWMLNTIGLFVTMAGALLMFMYLRGTPRFVEDSPEAKSAYAKHRLQLMIGVGLLAAWFVLQYLAAILL